MVAFLLGLVAWVAANLAGFAGLSPKLQAIIAGLGVVLGLFGIHSAPGEPSPLVLLLDKLGTGWKTIVGAVVGVLGYLLSPEVFGTLSPGFAHTLMVIGSVLAGFGLFHRQAKTAALAH